MIDTCVISELSARKPSDSVLRWFYTTPESDLYLSVVTIGELRKGIDKLQLNDPRRSKLENWLSVLRMAFAGRIIPFLERTAIKWGEIVGGSMRTGKSRPVIDSQLIATAFLYGMTLVTRNVQDMEGAGVPVFNPFGLADS